jgi:5,5'-dehydrodivanillate O-demethylase
MALSFTENETFTHVGPGTPGGEMLRRYWHPIGFSTELKGRPKRRRLLGEDLVLFRDDRGKLGLLELRCLHRGPSNSAISRMAACAAATMAGFTTSRAVLEQPGEPPESSFKERIRQRAYKVQELAG